MQSKAKGDGPGGSEETLGKQSKPKITVGYNHYIMVYVQRALPTPLSMGRDSPN